MSLPTFYIPPADISGDEAVLTGDELRHARLTLRLGVGDMLRIVDGQGSSYTGSVKSMAKEEGSLALSGKEIEPIPSFVLTVAMGIVQGERFDWAIQKATELGASSFLPLVTERTEGRYSGSWKRIERLERVIISACKQCGRARFPGIFQPVSLGELDTTSYGISIVFWEEEGTTSLKGTAARISPPGSCLMIIGPVGGLTEQEVKILMDKGCLAAGLGSRVLRTETAVTAGTALLQFLWGDLG